MKIDIPHHLSDAALEAELKALARGEQEATARLVSHLVEFDARRLYLPAGFSSLFNYCCEVLRLSEPAAYNRIEVARAARRFPDILPMLGQGSLSLATVRLLAPQLTVDNCEQLFAAAAGKSKREVEQMLAGRFPRPDAPTLIRKLPTAPSLPMPPVAPEPPAVGSTPVLPLASASPPPLTTPARRPVVRPLATDRYEIRFTATAETREKLRRAQDLLRHAVPTGDVAQVIDRALTLLIEDQRRKKIGVTDRPRASRGTRPGSRTVAATVRRTAWGLDEGRCSFVSEGGRRCDARAFIEFDHMVPHGLGGEGTVENIRLLCRAHNAFESERFYGRGRAAKSNSSRDEFAPAPLPLPP
jgi:hypothetical protein